MNIRFKLTPKQEKFINSPAFETLFGGAAGGGKSFVQLIDAFYYATRYPKSKQIIFRRTYADLEKSLIRDSLNIYPQQLATYNSSKHTWTFFNGSIIDFGYINDEKDVYQYQSAEYDVIRFDELTHFTEFMYVYMFSRCRGTNGYPKAIKSSTNPGNVGHTWVKKRFINIGEANKVHECKLESGETVTRLFIPSLVTDNVFLMQNDPDYIKRLDALPEKERKALKEGNWDILDGMFFSEFDRKIHVVPEFEIPSYWKHYIAFDYGLDMFAVVFVAVDTKGHTYVYDEIHESGLIVPEAAKLLKERMGNTKFDTIYAPPDLWNKHNDTGKSTKELFANAGIYLVKSSNNREAGWLCVKNLLAPYATQNEHTGEHYVDSKLKIFSHCVHLIECLPELQYDEKNRNDVATEPHEITHITDALRYFCVMRTGIATEPEKPKEEKFYDKFSHFSIDYNETEDYGEEIEVI